ncbi:hypothetical protein KSP40_PGU009548 [Platanthera guangdongensis]|uniref:sucrose synthase n=1 Tax=Platanthera guangdongensis TaxID=2320717 RepID=A0ABR2N2M0_9ASPA
MEEGRPQRSGSHSIVLLNEKPEMFILAGSPPSSIPSPDSVLETGSLESTLAPPNSLDCHPMTLEELQIGPSMTILFLPADTIATGHGSPYSPANLFLLLLPRRRRRRRSTPRVPTISSSPVSFASDELYPGVCSFCPLLVKPTTAVLPKLNLFSGASDLFSAASSYHELHSSPAIGGLERIPWFIHHFPEDVANELARELQATSDLIVGNYSDGNLVASLLAHKLGVTQCTIAHALKKTEYPNSDIYWKKFEDLYHFSCQFTADLIAMNHADFIHHHKHIPRDCWKILGSGMSNKMWDVLIEHVKTCRSRSSSGKVVVGWLKSRPPCDGTSSLGRRRRSGELEDE